MSSDQWHALGSKEKDRLVVVASNELRQSALRWTCRMATECTQTRKASSSARASEEIQTISLSIAVLGPFLVLGTRLVQSLRLGTDCIGLFPRHAGRRGTV